jgi:predicted Rossmann fold nucleotide-binding protein DprA/Smf involved in DNA uptake
MTALDDIRADIVRRHTEWLDKERFGKGQLAMIEAELEAHDRAVAAMQPVAAPEKRERAERRDIGAIVLAALTDAPQTMKQIAEKTGVPPSRVTPVLERLNAADKARGSSLGWYTAANARGETP